MQTARGASSDGLVAAAAGRRRAQRRTTPRLEMMYRQKRGDRDGAFAVNGAGDGSGVELVDVGGQSSNLRDDFRATTCILILASFRRVPPS